MSRVRNTPPSNPTAAPSPSVDSDTGALPEADTSTSHDPTLKWVLSDHMDLGETPEPVEQSPVVQKFVVREAAPASLVLPKGAKTPPPFNYALVERAEAAPPVSPPAVKVPSEKTTPPARRPTPVLGVSTLPAPKTPTAPAVAPKIPTAPPVAMAPKTPAAPPLVPLPGPKTPPPEPVVEVLASPAATRPADLAPASEALVGATPSDFFTAAPTPPPTPADSVEAPPAEAVLPAIGDSAELPAEAVEILPASSDESPALKAMASAVVHPKAPLPEDITVPTSPADASESQPMDAREVEPEAVMMMADSSEHVLEAPTAERSASTTPPPVPPSRASEPAQATPRVPEAPPAKRPSESTGRTQQIAEAAPAAGTVKPAAPVVAATLFEEFQTPGAPSTEGLPEALARRSLQKRSKPWYEEVFDDDYLRTVPFMTPEQTVREAGFIRESLALKPSAEVLDVGCGYGRHALELAQQGCQVTGLDLSLPLLIKAADQAQKRGLTVNFVHADMREMTFNAQFDAAYCMLSSFGYFDEETNLRVASAVCKALRPGGRFLLDIINRDYIVGDLPSRVWWEGDGCVILEEVDFNYHTSRVLIRRSVVFGNGRQTEQELSMRAYSLHEVGRLLRQAGLRVLDVSGSLATKSRFFGAASKSIIALCEKPLP